MVKIQLTINEMKRAAYIGLNQTFTCIQNDSRHHKWQGDLLQTWNMAIEGRMGEAALAKYLDIPYFDSGKGGTDVGKLEEVRTTSFDSHNSHLILHPEDKPDHRYWHVTGFMGEYTIRGWTWARDLMQQQFWGSVRSDNKRPGYITKQDNLRHPSIIKQEYDDERKPDDPHFHIILPK